MFTEISLIAIGTYVILKILRKKESNDVGTQTDGGIWLPQVPMYLDDSSGSELSQMEMEVIHGYCENSDISE